MMTSEEITKICEEQGIEYISFTQDSCDDYFVGLYCNKVTPYVFDVEKRVFKVQITYEDLVEVFRHFGITKPMFSCAMYPIVENPTPVYYSAITGEIVQIGDDEE